MAFIFDPGVLRSLFGAEYNQFDTLPIDITVSEVVSERDAVIDKPAENGGVATLGTVSQPTVISISGIFNDSRVDGESWSDKKDKLLEIRQKKVPFTVVTSIGAYDSMVFESIDFNRDRTNKGALFFIATLRQVTIISARTIAVPADFKKNASARDVGKKQAVEMTPEQQQKAARTLFKFGWDEFRERAGGAN